MSINNKLKSKNYLKRYIKNSFVFAVIVACISGLATICYGILLLLTAYPLIGGILIVLLLVLILSAIYTWNEVEKEDAKPVQTKLSIKISSIEKPKPILIVDTLMIKDGEIIVDGKPHLGLTEDFKRFKIGDHISLNYLSETYNVNQDDLLHCVIATLCKKLE